MPPTTQDNRAERKIYFYRAFSGDGNADFKLDRDKLVNCIDKLKGTNAYYLDEGDDKITCAEVVKKTKSHRLKLYAIRRQDLPAIDDGSGSGQVKDLSLAATEGLAEAIHIVLYPNNIIAAEFFFYGPRIARLQAFINRRCGMNVRIEQLYRGDAVERALKFQDVRVLRIKVHPSQETKKALSEAGLDGAIDAAKKMGAGVYADLTLRAEKNDSKFTQKAKKFIRTLKQTDTRDLFDGAGIEGLNPDSDHVEPVNLLSDQLVRVAKIKRQSKRTRALDSDDAFAAIKTAYDDVKAELPKDAVVKAG